MPSDTEIITVDLGGFKAGLNRDADPFLIEEAETPSALNVDFGLRGEVSKRKGYSRWDSPTVATVFRRIVSWVRQGGNEHVVAVNAGGDVYEDNGTALADSTKNVGPASPSEDTYDVAIASLNNLLYVTSIDTTNSPLSFDGTTWTSETATIFDGTANRFPHAKFVVTKHERIFAANISDSGTRHRSRLHWSDLGDAETWQATSYIDFDPDDGEEITALISYGEGLIVFKETSVQLLSGTSEESFERIVLDHQLGTVSPMTAVTFGGRLVWFDRNTGVQAFDGASFTQVSEKINNYLLDGFNYDYAYKASAFVHRNRLYLSVPWGTDQYNSRTFVLHLITGAWSEYDFGVADAAEYGGAVLSAGPRNAQGVYKLFDTINDSGSAITSYVYTPWLALGGVAALSRVRRLDLAFSAKGDFDVTVDAYRDFFEDAPYASYTVNTDPGGAIWGSDPWGGFLWGGSKEQVLARVAGLGGLRSRAVQFKFSVNGVGDDFQLNRGSMQVSALKRIRGEE